MEVLYPRCAGLDVHKETVVACVRLATGDDVVREVRMFATTTGVSGEASAAVPARQSMLIARLGWLRLRRSRPPAESPPPPGEARDLQHERRRAKGRPGRG